MKKVAITFLLFGYFLCFGFIYALEEAGVTLPDQKIYPRSFYYPVKRLMEKAWERLKFSDNTRYDFNKSLLPTRLAELAYVVKEDQKDQVQKSSERFSYQAGITTEKLKQIENSQDEKKTLLEQFTSYTKVLEKLRDHYPANSSYWMSIQHSINSLKLYSEILNK